MHSYTLREVAELLGVSKRTLQRRIQEGAFPGRFLAPGRHGLETRIPADDVQRVLEDLRGQGRADWRRDPMRSEVPRRPQRLESLVPYEASHVAEAVSSGPPLGSALSEMDLEVLRDGMLAIVREEREMFLEAVRDALGVRDQAITGLQNEVSALRGVMESVRSGLETMERRVSRSERPADPGPQAWGELLSGHSNDQTVDVDALLREIGELESMLGSLDDA